MVSGGVDLLITVVVPFHTHREKNGYLQRALNSIHRQTIEGIQVIAVRDEEGQGAPATRHAGLMLVGTPWVAFLDSDDEMDPEHLEKLLDTAETTGADYVYSHYRVKGGRDPFPKFLGQPWDNNKPHETTVTTLVRTELAQRVGFLASNDVRSADSKNSREDWFFTLGCMNAGAKIVHRPEITWTWHHHGANTSGLAGRGDARP